MRPPSGEVVQVVRIPTVFYSVSGVAGETQTLNFVNGSLFYFDNYIQQSYPHILIDNIGTGIIRFTLRPGIDLTNSIIGAKTLKASDSLYISDDISYLIIYFVESSTVELILVSD